LSIKRENFPIEILTGGFLLFELLNHTKNNLWEKTGFWRDLMQISLKIEQYLIEIEIKEIKEKEVSYVMNNLSFKTLLVELSEGEIKFIVNYRFYRAAFSAKNSYQSFATISGLDFIIERQHVLHSDVLYETSELQHSDSGNNIHAPMFGKLVKINVNEGDPVKKGQTLLVMESMKMENNIVSQKDAHIGTIHVKAGEMIEINQLLISLSE
jgi:biotin carboxyl carrier protein